MANLSLIIEKQGCFNITIKILNLVDGWNIPETSIKNVSLSSHEECLFKEEIHFILFEVKFTEEYIRKIKMIHGSYPLIYLLYLYPHLYNRQFIKLTETGISGCIMGMNRHMDLIQYLGSLWDKPLEASAHIKFTSKRGVST